MNNSCPVVCGYLRTVRSFCCFGGLIYESYVPQFEDLEELAQSVGGGLPREHQRAFLCIELLQARIAPCITTGEPQQSLALRWPRSREGLNLLITTVLGDEFNLLGLVTEYAYSRGISGKGVDQILLDNQHRLLKVYKLLREAVVLLRRSLKNPEVPLRRVGHRLAVAALIGRHTIPDLLIMGRELIEQDENNARRVWEQVKK